MNPIIPKALKSISSVSREDAVRRVRSLYFEALRAAPLIIDYYHLEVDKRFLRRRISDEFRLHQSVSDPQVIDMLLFKGTMELEECLMKWKTPSHIHRYVSTSSQLSTASKPKSFLDKFYNNDFGF